MKHRITATAFKELKRNLGAFLATCSLRATLRPFGLATSFELVPENVRGTADVIIDIRPPTARHIAAGRRLAGLPPLPRDVLRKLAQQDMSTIEFLAARQSLLEADFAAPKAQHGGKKTAKLGELPGFALARP